MKQLALLLFLTPLSRPLIGAHDMPIGISLEAGRFCDQHLLSIGKMLAGPLMARDDNEANACILNRVRYRGDAVLNLKLTGF